jgi:hypothetical protein
MMIAQPDWIGPADVQDGIAKAAARRSPGWTCSAWSLDEGLSVQILQGGAGKAEDHPPSTSAAALPCGTVSLLARGRIHWLGSDGWLT